ncbi:hypothetical protein PspLS_09701 [Pyricularia sp. CBS 133598]|nr:hypothetical protein PspLS_09701 [Pyricularia sp. CBS 133598]
MIAISQFLVWFIFATAALAVKPIPPSQSFFIWYGRPGENKLQQSNRRERIKEALESQEWRSESRYTRIEGGAFDFGYVRVSRFETNGGNFTFAEKFLADRGYKQDDNWEPRVFFHSVVFAPAYDYVETIAMFERIELLGSA